MKRTHMCLGVRYLIYAGYFWLLSGQGHPGVIIPPFHWPPSLAIMTSMARLQKSMKRDRSASKWQILRFPAMHHAFCTLVLRSWRFRCANTKPTVRFYCACIVLSIRSIRSTCAQSTTKACVLRSLYDRGVLATLVMRFYSTHGALLYKSAANCTIPSIIY